MMTYYQVNAGALPIDAPTYVWRDADEELYEFVRDPETHNRACYILAARQMGKSSLMVRTAKRLADEGVICVQVNLQRFGQALSEDALYLSLLQVICKQIQVYGYNLDRDLSGFWQEKPVLPPAMRFQNFAEKILQQIGDQRLILFFDEIQNLIYWQLQDGFIGVIKALSDGQYLDKLTFVLLGVVKPSDLLTHAGVAFNAAKPIELKNFEKDCQPLLKGLTNVSDNPEDVFQKILVWTGGQPFLTQRVCYLVASQRKFQNESDVKHQIEKLVRSAIIEDWRKQDKYSHLTSIEHWFTIGYPSRKEKIAALDLYNRIRHIGPVKFSSNREEQIKQMNLIISGLVAKSGQCLNVANQIYREVFTEEWIEETKQFIQNQEEYMPSTKIFNRDVFILVDQSATMDTKDPGSDKTRWELLAESLAGDVKKILKPISGKNICEKINLYLFSRKREGLYFDIPPNDLKKNIFDENVPDANTFICPTFEKCLGTWFQGGRKAGKGAFIIIYTDGMLDDRTQFEKAITDTCEKLNNQDEIKIVMVGVGNDVKTDPKPFLDLDFNLITENKDVNGAPCNIFVFDLENEMDDIIELLSRQLEKDPAMKVPEWVRQRHPDWYKNYQQYIRNIEDQQ